MSPRRLLPIRRLLLTPLLLLAACQSAQMRVPATLAGAPEITCSGRQGFMFNEAFDCSPYRVVNVHRSWTVTRSWGDVWFQVARADERYEFVVETGAGVWDGQFAVGAAVDQVQLQDVFGGTLEIRLLDDRFLLGSMGARGDTEPWELAVGSGTTEQVMRGALTRGDVEIRIEGTNRLAGTSIPTSEATGYVFLLDGREIAAVEVINSGALRMLPALDSDLREALVTASAGLLLYRDLLAGRSD